MADGDVAAIVERAHKLAGISALFGHEDIGEAAFELEQAALDGQDIASAAEPLRALLTQLNLS